MYEGIYGTALLVVAVVLGIKASPKAAAGWLTAFFVIGSIPIGNGAALLGTLPLAIVVYPLSYVAYRLVDAAKNSGHNNSENQIFGISRPLVTALFAGFLCIIFYGITGNAIIAILGAISIFWYAAGKDLPTMKR
jgi:hypothetical protein